MYVCVFVFVQHALGGGCVSEKPFHSFGCQHCTLTGTWGAGERGCSEGNDRLLKIASTQTLGNVSKGDCVGKFVHVSLSEHIFMSL